MRQLLVESLLLAFTGAALGVAAGYWGLPAMLRLLPPNSVPVGNLMAVPVDVPVLLFSASLNAGDSPQIRADAIASWQARVGPVSGS